MRVVNIKELKARLSSYLRDVGKGDELLVTDRGRICARLGPPGHPGDSSAGATKTGTDLVARLAAMGARLPLRPRRLADYQRPGENSGLTTRQIDDLLDQARGER